MLKIIRIVTIWSLTNERDNTIRPLDIRLILNWTIPCFVFSVLYIYILCSVFNAWTSMQFIFGFIMAIILVTWWQKKYIFIFIELNVFIYFDFPYYWEKESYFSWIAKQETQSNIVWYALGTHLLNFSWVIKFH